MTKRNLLVGLTILLVVVILVFVLRSKPTVPAKAAKAAEAGGVEVGEQAQRNAGLTLATVAEMPIRGVVKTTGIVSEDQARVAHIFPLARGIVEKVYVQLGAKVLEGQPLLLYDNIELGQLIGEYLSLRGGLERLAAQQEVAKKSLDRAEALIKVQAIAQREYELRQAEYDQARAAVQSQRADVARVEEQLHRFGLNDEDVSKLGSSEHGTHRTASHNVLRAPRSGVITKFDVSQGEVVEPSKELLTIVDTSVMWILADLYEKDLGAIRAGGQARISVTSYPDETFTGQMTYVSDYLDAASRTAKVRCVVANRDGRLKLEMFATVEIPAAKERTGLAVPAAAIQQVDNDTVVFVQQDATHFEKRVVQLGEKSGGSVEVRSGVTRGEIVVTAGSFYLKSALLREQIGEKE